MLQQLQFLSIEFYPKQMSKLGAAQAFIAVFIIQSNTDLTLKL